MHTVAQFIAASFAPLSDSASFLATQFGLLACGASGSFLLAALVVSSLALAAGSSVWAILESGRRIKRLTELQNALRRAQRAVRIRNNLIESLPESTLVLRGKDKTVLSFRRGNDIFHHCLAGPDAPRLANAVNALLTQGIGFAFTVRTLALREMAVRGEALGDCSAIFFRDTDERNVLSLLRLAGQHETPRIVPALEGPRVAPEPVSAPIIVRRATLLSHADAHPLESAIVVGSDGRLKRYNAAFARQWHLREDELRGEPHISELAARCAAQVGSDAIWDVVTAATTSLEPERLGDWGSLTRGDGREISLRMSRLGDGGTLVIFAAETYPDAQEPPLVETTAMAA